jgi:hypothetical protein
MEWHPSFDRNQTDGLLARIERVAKAAAAAEREACAKVCEDDPSRAWDWLGEIRPGGHYAAAIRAQAADRLARHGIQLPDEDEEYGNPSF